MEPLTIGKAARLAGVGVETLRFYERKGLIPRPPTPPFGPRIYPMETVKRIRFIRRAKELGFSLREVAELLSLRADPEATCGDVRRKAEEKIAEMEARIRTLEKMKQALSRLAASCKGAGPVRECPILDAMEEGAGKGVRRKCPARPSL